MLLRPNITVRYFDVLRPNIMVKQPERNVTTTQHNGETVRHNVATTKHKGESYRYTTTQHNDEAT